MENKNGTKNKQFFPIVVCCNQVVFKSKQRRNVFKCKAIKNKSIKKRPPYISMTNLPQIKLEIDIRIDIMTFVCAYYEYNPWVVVFRTKKLQFEHLNFR